MPFRVLEIQHGSEFPELFRVFHASFTDPGTALWPLFTADYPRPTDQSQDQLAHHEAALHETTARMLSWHQADPTSHWIKVVDENTGAVVGGGRWALYEKEQGNPYEGHGGGVEASWWPEGTPRKVASGYLNEFLATSARLMGRPHAFLNILFTHPSHRRKGVASLVMGLGLERADKLGLASYIEATDEGKPCYETFGFKVIDRNELQPKEGAMDEE